MFRPCSSYASGNARDMLRPSTKYVSTELEMCFNRLRYLSAVGRGMFRPSREVCFDHARVVLAAMLEICFDRPQSMFRPSSRYVSTVLSYVPTMHEVYFDCRSRYVSTVLKICFAVHKVWFDRRSRYVSTLFEPCFDRARDIF